MALKEEMVKSVETLLEKLRDWNGRQTVNDQKERFNIFKLCGVDHYETIHSAILAEFLSPKGTHKLGNEFLRAFCRGVGLDFERYKNAKIYREYEIPEGRLDILIDAGKDRIVIENKIYANEGDRQLPRYADWLARTPERADRQLLFLTLDGHAPENGECAVPVRCISYREHILNWLGECIGLAAEKPFVRESLLQYKNLVEELTGSVAPSVDEQLAKTIMNDFAAAVTVRDVLNAVKGMWLWDNILEPLRNKGFAVDRTREQMMDSSDVYFWYENPETNIKVLYAFDQYCFQRPRREITSHENGSEVMKKSTRGVPHRWDDDFFRSIHADNAQSIAEAMIAAIVRDAREHSQA